MQKEIVIKAENIKFSYDDAATYSLDGFDVKIEKGKKVAFVGSNGAGKSTFFLCLNGIHKILSGNLEVCGKPVKYDRKSLIELRKNVGIVFQDPDNQLFSASVYQEISFGALNIGMTKEETELAVDRVIEELELSSFSHKPVHALSGGQKKQVSIADVLVMNPEIIILDEPSAALDPKHTRMVNEIIEKLSDTGITVLISTHDIDYAYSWADEVAVIHEGKVLSYGSPQSVFKDDKLLEKTNLRKPIVLELFDKLCKKGILSNQDDVPQSLKELESMI